MPNSLALPNVSSIWLPRAAEAALVLFAAWLVAGWLAGGMVDQAMRGAVSSDTGVLLPDEAEIAAFPLFGKQAAAPTTPKPAAAPVAAAPTRLNIRLLGTVVAGDRSLAVMKLGEGKEKVVFVSEDIQPGVTLEEVQVDAIIVNNRGRKEKVLMAKGALGSGAQSYTAPPTMTEPIRHGFTREALQSQMQDLPKLLTGALAIPHQTNGNPDGFLIQNIVSGSLYEQAGLMDGDVIRRVNGKPVNTPEQGIALFQQLQNAGSLDLEITRAGASQRLHFDIH